MRAICFMLFPAWMLLGGIWMMSLKWKIFQRTKAWEYHALAALVDAGDSEAIELRRRTKVFLGVGVVLAVLLALVR